MLEMECTILPTDSAEDKEWKQRREAEVRETASKLVKKKDEELAKVSSSNKETFPVEQHPELMGLIGKLATLSPDERRAQFSSVPLRIPLQVGKASVRNMDENLQFTLWQYVPDRVHVDEALEEAFKRYVAAVKKDLADDGLELDDFYAAGNYLAWKTLDNTFHNLPWKFNLGPCMVFVYAPLFEKGEDTLYRVKPWSPRVKDGETIKYEVPPNQSHRPYMPFGVARYAGAKELVITEGEKNTLAALKAGLPCVGIPGVYCPHEPDKTPKRLHSHILHVLKEYGVKKIVLAFDSDTKTNKGVHDAIEAATLIAAIDNIDVDYVTIPANAGEKAGLGNYLASGQRWEDLAKAEYELPYLDNGQRMLDGLTKKYVTVPRTGIACFDRMSRLYPGFYGIGLQGPVLFRQRPGEGNARPIVGPAELMAELKRDRIVQWYTGTGLLSEKEFFVTVCNEVKKHAAISLHPTFPKRNDTLYDLVHSEEEIDRKRVAVRQRIADGGDGLEYVKKFLANFPFTSEIDRDICIVAMATALWGGGAGLKPGFMLTAAKPGNAKSSTMFAILKLLGGSDSLFNMNYTEDIKDDTGRARTNNKNYVVEFKRSIIQKNAYGISFPFLDNIKDEKFGTGESESLITAEDISGWRIYYGNAKIPNYFMYWYNFNEPKLTRDMARRVVSIDLNLTEEHQQQHSRHVEDVKEFTEAHRLDVWAELLVLLETPEEIRDVNVKTTTLKWATWERNVLACMPNGTELAATILGRMQSHAAIVKESEFYGTLMEELAILSEKNGGDALPEVILLTAKAMNTFYVECDPMARQRSEKWVAKKLAEELKDYKNVCKLSEERRTSWFRGWVVVPNGGDASAIVVPGSKATAEERYIVCTDFSYSGFEQRKTWIHNLVAPSFTKQQASLS